MADFGGFFAMRPDPIPLNDGILGRDLNYSLRYLGRTLSCSGVSQTEIGIRGIYENEPSSLGMRDPVEHLIAEVTAAGWYVEVGELTLTIRRPEVPNIG